MKDKFALIIWAIVGAGVGALVAYVSQSVGGSIAYGNAVLVGAVIGVVGGYTTTAYP